MQTNLADFIRDTPEGREADAILRSCVHCGFCTATCPTYQLLGDELDGPRGRIYLMKLMLEGATPTAKTQLHLDRCLTCRACETTCPSGVKYGELLDIGRAVVDRAVQRPLWQRLQRAAMCAVLPRSGLFAALLGLGRLVKPVLPFALAAKIPERRGDASLSLPVATTPHPRRMLLLDGCVQPALSPQINAAAVALFDRIGIALITASRAGCCGALRFHLDATNDALDDMRRNIDAWWPQIEAGCEAIVITASGCGVMVKDYGRLLAGDTRYAAKAARVAALARDVAEVAAAESGRLEPLLAVAVDAGLIAFHPPCTLQHGMQIRGVAENLLRKAGYRLAPVPDSHLCCGSAGTYSISQPELSLKLRDNKLAALAGGMPQAIATANIGCLSHLQSGTALPVRHWIELVAARLDPTAVDPTAAK
jgi:glycolate oxidase iron-sulfur subunit